MISIGITGGIASGKSTVARLLTERGAVVVDADRLAHETYAPGTPGFDALVESLRAGRCRRERHDRPSRPGPHRLRVAGAAEAANRYRLALDRALVEGRRDAARPCRGAGIRRRGGRAARGRLARLPRRGVAGPGRAGSRTGAAARARWPHRGRGRRAAGSAGAGIARQRRRGPRARQRRRPDELSGSRWKRPGALRRRRSPHPSPLPEGEGTRSPHPGPLPEGEGTPESGPFRALSTNCLLPSLDQCDVESYFALCLCAQRSASALCLSAVPQRHR